MEEDLKAVATKGKTAAAEEEGRWYKVEKKRGGLSFFHSGWRQWQNGEQ